MKKILLSTMGAVAIAFGGMAVAPSTAQAGIAVDDDGKFKLGGTVRVRAENDKRYDSGLTRTRYRLRLRLNGSYQADENWSMGFRLATNADGINSPHKTFGTTQKPGTRADFGLDRAYVKYKNGGLSLWGGKNGINFHELTEVFWDGDIQPEGFAATYKNSDFTLNGGYFQLNDTGWGDVGEIFLGTYQGVYSSEVADGIKLTAAVGGGSLLDSGAAFAADQALIGSLQVKGSNWRIGGEYIKSNAANDDAAYTIQARYKFKDIGNGLGLRAYYYHVEAFSVLADGLVTQDNFSTPSGDGGVTNFKGIRVQLDYKLANNTSMDLRYLSGKVLNLAVANPGAVATTYNLGQKRVRYQANLNVKF